MSDAAGEIERETKRELGVKKGVKIVRDRRGRLLIELTKTAARNFPPGGVREGGREREREGEGEEEREGEREGEGEGGRERGRRERRSSTCAASELCGFAWREGEGEREREVSGGVREEKERGEEEGAGEEEGEREGEREEE